MNRASVVKAIIVILIFSGLTVYTAEVSAQVIGCSVSVSPLRFGSIRLPLTQPAAGQGSVTVTCEEGLGYEVSLNQGLHYIHPMRSVQREDGVERIGYTVHQDANYQTFWGDGTQMGPVKAVVGSGTPQENTVYARLWAMGNFPAGRYTDLMTVTVQF
ncbi:MAG: spore coat protein U domain-containing protein [Nitrospira sp.]|nr:spore coat protein U domain-containing protein [bacterium]MBL7049713.1 spore coat protein U domain-containing protein [Nitrospira sp.]